MPKLGARLSVRCELLELMDDAEVCVPAGPGKMLRLHAESERQAIEARGECAGLSAA